MRKDASVLRILELFFETGETVAPVCFANGLALPTTRGAKEV